MDRSRRLGRLLVAVQFMLLAALTAPWSSLWHLPLLYGAGSVLVTEHPPVLAAAVGLLVLVMAKARWEESMLIRSTPNYRKYAQRTRRFIPWVGRLRS